MHYNPEDTAIVYSPHMEDFAARVWKHLRLKLDADERLKLDASERSEFKLSPVSIKYFPNKEIKARIDANVRGRHVYVIHGFTDRRGEYEPNIGYITLFQIAQALFYASAREATFIVPHRPYERQDRLDEAHVPITAKLMCELLSTACVKMHPSLITFDMHAPQIQAFADFPSDNLHAAPLFGEYLRRYSAGTDFVILSPDVHGAERARSLAKLLERGIVICDKRRSGEDGQPQVMHVIGDVKEKCCVAFDDMIDTSKTLLEAVDAVRQNGANNTAYACATHALFSTDEEKPAWKPEEEIRKAGLKVIVTDTIPRPMQYYENNRDWLTVLSVAPMVAQGIYEIQTAGSISNLFKTGKYSPSDFFDVLYPDKPPGT